MPTDYIDIHTHNLNAHNAIISVSPYFSPDDGKLYSVGIHPWDTLESLPPDWSDVLRTQARKPNVVAVGEAGFDRLKGADLVKQTEIFLTHVEISEAVEKPLILHVVKAFPEMIAFKRRLKPRQPWIVHGFRGKPELARELVKYGFYISLGEKFNPEVLDIVPRDRLFAETDESYLPIDDIISRIYDLDKSLPFTIFGIGNNALTDSLDLNDSKK